MHYTLGFNSLKSGYITFCWSHWLFIFNPMTYWLWLKRFCQRGFYGYAENDYWDADGYLEEVILGVIRDLKNNTQGFPNSLSDYDMDHIYKDDDIPDTGSIKWQSILQEIIEGMEAAQELRMETTVPEGVYSKGPWTFKDIGNGLSELNDESNHTFNKEMYDEWRKPLEVKQKRAMLLLAEHWGSFWD